MLLDDGHAIDPIVGDLLLPATGPMNDDPLGCWHGPQADRHGQLSLRKIAAGRHDLSAQHLVGRSAPRPRPRSRLGCSCAAHQLQTQEMVFRLLIVSQQQRSGRRSV